MKPPPTTIPMTMLSTIVTNPIPPWASPRPSLSVKATAEAPWIRGKGLSQVSVAGGVVGVRLGRRHVTLRLTSRLWC
jgi:hypothetical protein